MIRKGTGEGLVLKQYKIFAVNPGSTSTKIAVFQGEDTVFSKNISHDAEKLKKFKEIRDQLGYRREMILQELEQAHISLEDIDAFAGRGGAVANIAGGVYKVNEQMLQDVVTEKYEKHPASLGCQIAQEFADKYGKDAYIVNPPPTDEFQELARVTGLRDVYRLSYVHALNQKEVGIRYARAHKKKYEEMNLIICHIGGGISVTAHQHGKMIDSNDILSGDGPMAPTRAGAMPARQVLDLAFSGKYTYQQLYDRITRTGGLVDHLGTSDAREVKKMIEEGDLYAKLIYDAMIYEIGKTAGSMAAVLCGEVDGIVLTGGISHDKYVVDHLKNMLSFIAPVEVMAGEFEMEALAAGVIRVLSGEEEAKSYTGEPVWSGFHMKMQM